MSQIRHCDKKPKSSVVGGTNGTQDESKDVFFEGVNEIQKNNFDGVVEGMNEIL
jgi:hypothetical protein